MQVRIDGLQHLTIRIKTFKKYAVTEKIFKFFYTVNIHENEMIELYNIFIILILKMHKCLSSKSCFFNIEMKSGFPYKRANKSKSR